MANQILVNPHPYGVNDDQNFQDIEGSIVLAGSAVANGEPINWADLISGNGYNEINFAGNGVHGSAAAFVTTFSGDGTTVTATANNNFSVGQPIRFKGCTSTMGLLLNGTTAVVATRSATQFTFASAVNDTGTGELGLALYDRTVRPLLASAPAAMTATVTALSASGSVLTVTAANAFLPGAGVIVNVATGTLGPKLAGLLLPVLQSTGTAFTATMPSALSGSTGVGTATGNNPAQPFSVLIWSALASGYIYQYKSTFGTLFVMDTGGFTPAGTNDSSTPPVFTGTAVAAAALQKLAAAAYPAGVLADVVKFSARFIKS